MQHKTKAFFSEHLYILLAIGTTLAVYLQILHFSHISWDDPEMVFKNRDVIDFKINKLFSNHYVGNYIPISMLLHAINWQLFGNEAWGHHFVNLLIHIVNGWLVFRLSQKLFAKQEVAVVACLIFLLHPLQVESVAWISELKNLFSTTFYLASLLAYLKFSESSNKLNYLYALLLYVLGCLSKPSVVILPLVLFLFDLFRNKNLLTVNLLNKIPFLMLSLLFGLINLKTQAADQFINHAHEFPFFQRFAFAGFALLKYCVLFIVPYNLSVIYPYPPQQTGIFMLGLLVMILILAAIFLLYKRKQFNSLFLLLFGIFNYALVLQFVPFGEVLYADRYSYIPLLAFAWGLGLLVVRARLSLKAVAAFLLLIPGFVSFSRATKWKNAITLYEDVISKHPGQFVALNSAGVELMFLNEDDKALQYFNSAVKAAPNNYKGYYNRGLLLIKNNNTTAAIKSFNQSIALYEYSKAYLGRATAYLMAGDVPKALNDAEYVLNKEPDNAKAHYVLGNCYNQMNRLGEALNAYNTCIALNAEEADYYFKRAIIKGKQQDFKSSLNDLDICISLNPNLFEAFYWRGVAKVNLGENPCDDFSAAARKNFEPAVSAYNSYCRR